MKLQQMGPSGKHNLTIKMHLMVSCNFDRRGRYRKVRNCPDSEDKDCVNPASILPWMVKAMFYQQDVELVLKDSHHNRYKPMHASMSDALMESMSEPIKNGHDQVQRDRYYSKKNIPEMERWNIQDGCTSQFATKAPKGMRSIQSKEDPRIHTAGESPEKFGQQIDRTYLEHMQMCAAEYGRTDLIAAPQPVDGDEQ